MPRSHVSVARFYDWTDDLGDCFSVSRLYREIANIPRLDSKGVLRGSHPALGGAGGTAWINNGPGSNTTGSSVVSIASASGAVVHHGSKGRGQHQLYLSPGRMFVRDKKALTRGEREIIEGIYKNRGDVGCSPRDALSRSEFQVRSHQEAWLAGKGGANPDGVCALGRAVMKGVALETTAKGGGTVRNTSSNTGESQKDKRSPTAASSLEDFASTVNRSLSSRERHSPRDHKQHRAENHFTLQAGQPAPASPEAEERPGTHEVALRTLHPHNHVDYWDSRPSAPPSSPNRLEETLPDAQQPPTHPPAPRLPPTPGAACETSSLDKLLNMRPSLPANAILLAEKIQSSPYRTNRQRISSSQSSQRSSDMIFTGDQAVIFHDANRQMWSSNCEQNSKGDPGLVYGKHFGSYGYIVDKTDADDTDIFFGSDFDATSRLPSTETVEKLAPTPENENDKKKVKVRVYLPIVGTETHEDDAIINPPLAKERPLSQSSFKTKNPRQEARLS